MSDPPTPHSNVIDYRHSACLSDVGAPGHVAATAVGADGVARLVVADRNAIDDKAVRYDPTCAAVAHEQTGPLPLEFVRRLTVARRSQRGHCCGRPTKTGRPCRITVTNPGEPCRWHRQNQHAHNTTTKGQPG